MDKKYICCLALSALAIALIGCSDEKESPAGTASSATETRSVPVQAPPKDSGVALPKSDATAATVNGVVIKTAEVQDEMQNLMMQFRGQIPQGQMAEMAPMLQKRALENLINRKLLIDEVTKEGVSIEGSAIDEKLKEIEARFPTPEKFNEQLSLSGMTREKLRGEIGQNLKLQKLLDDKMAGALDVSDEETLEYYENNQESFNRSEEVKASHILIGLKAEDSDEAKNDKRKKLSDIREEIVNGADFGELAAQHSECPSNAKQGDLGFFSRDRMVPAFSEAAFSMEVGSVSDIVETQFGYHLIKVTDRHAEGIMPLEEVEEDIKTMLGQQNQQQAFEKYVNELREAGEIEYGEGYAPPPEADQE